VEKLARSVDKEEKIWVKLIVSAHLVERISQVASTARSFPHHSLHAILCVGNKRRKTGETSPSAGAIHGWPRYDRRSGASEMEGKNEAYMGISTQQFLYCMVFNILALLQEEIHSYW